jgi:hypothetical protein
MDADSIRIECEENGFHLIAETSRTHFDFRISDPEALYREVTGMIRPWLAEKERGRLAFLCVPDESGGYALDDPKHPDFHSVHADIWDMREGK